MFLALVVVDAGPRRGHAACSSSRLVDDGIYPKDSGVVVRLSLLVAAIAVVSAALTLVERWFSARIGEGLIYDLRTQVFAHVLRQPVAFFTRAQTGALVTRLNNDVIGAQQAFTSVLSSVVSNAITLVLIIGGDGSALVAADPRLTRPRAVLPRPGPGRWVAASPSLAHEQMVHNAELGTRMTERFNVAGALLVKLFGSPAVEDERVRRARRAGARHRGAHRREPLGVLRRRSRSSPSLATAMVYGVGGVMAVEARSPSAPCSP